MKNKIIGIIVEFNPLHNGHKKLIDTIKAENPDAFLIAAMSGNFVQRGELSIYDKWVRAESAIEHGVDLIVEIPPYYVLNNANIFAKKAVEQLGNFGASEIYFGTENLEINEIELISEYVISNESKLDKLKKEYHSLPKAFEALLNIKLKPNDTLGICYILEAKKSKIPMIFKRIERESNGTFKSASDLRAMIKNNINSNNSLIDKNEKIYNIENYSDIIIGKLLTSDTDINIINYLKTKCLENNIKSFDHLIDISSNKNFTKSRLRRELIKYIIELEGSNKNIILAINNNGKNILKNNEPYSFRHDKENNDNYKVERFISIKDNISINEKIAKHTKYS